MITFSKKTTFLIMLFMCVVLVLSLIDVQWDQVQAGTRAFNELGTPIASFIVIGVFFMQYMQKRKEEK